MKKRRLKEYVLPVLYGMISAFCLVAFLTIKSGGISEVSEIPENFTYVTNKIFLLANSKTVLHILQL